MSPTLLHLVTTSYLPIIEQLRLEEALLRCDTRNWCLINHGSPPAIVMGISGQPDLLIHPQKWQHAPLPLIRRFSGGGTVVVDESTTFVTFILNNGDLPVDPFPSSIMQWTEKLYHPVFRQDIFQLRENDYVLGERKFGGNAQHLCKKRWLHHSSLLWDYCPERMDYLTLPIKKPLYRGERSHQDFLCRLKEIIPSREELTDRLYHTLQDHFSVKETALAEALPIMECPHRKATVLLTHDYR